MVYRVYSTKSCPKCEQLKAALVKAGIAFENIDMSTPEALTELRINGVFTLSAPVLQEEDRPVPGLMHIEGDPSVRGTASVGPLEPIPKADVALCI